MIATGAFVETSLRFEAEDMAAFAALSGDRSAVHTDPAFARARGYQDIIVYGGLMLARLSGALGGLLPGEEGISARWSIDYRAPLYLGETAVLSLEVTHVSPGTGLVELAFRIRVGERLVATGKAQSLVPPERLAP